jgi:large subunit ribosomal protein L11
MAVVQASSDVGEFKLVISAGSATPAPPIGTALGPRGINIPEFVKQFNAATQGMEKGMPIPTIITFNKKQRTFSFVLKTPPVSYLIIQAAGLKKGSSQAGKENVGKINMEKVKKIAEMKFSDMNAINIEQAIKMVIGSAKSMGIQITQE